MTLGVTGVVVRPLHELVDLWKRDGRVVVALGSIAAQDCLCGAVISAANKPDAIEKAVRFHNATIRHVQWAIRNGWRDG